MTALRHNGRLDRLDPGRHPTVGAALEACLHADGEEHVLVAVHVDGRAIDESEFPELYELASDGVAKIDVISRPLRGVAIDALESAADYAPGLAAALARAAGLLRAGESGRAVALWAEACEALEMLLHALAVVGAALTEARDLPAATAIALRAPLAAAVAAHERGDLLALADLLDYELAAWVEALAGRLRALHTAGAAAAAEG